MTYSQLQELINKASDLYPSFLYYTRGNFQVNDRYYTASGKLLSQNSPDAPQVQIIPGKNIIDKYEVRYEEVNNLKLHMMTNHEYHTIIIINKHLIQMYLIHMIQIKYQLKKT